LWEEINIITLENSIEIKTTPEKIFNWFKNMDNKRFREWHPNHRKFVKVTGGMDEGDVLYFEEYINGKWFKLKIKITKIEKSEKGWRADFESVHWLGRLIGTRISFIAEAKGGTCIFTHVESFGFKMPIISSLILKLFKWRIPLIEKEDNINLKKIMEGG
jgi:hypothetical protein